MVPEFPELSSWQVRQRTEHADNVCPGSLGKDSSVVLGAKVSLQRESVIGAGVLKGRKLRVEVEGGFS